jgi:hypothetical protein
MATQIRRDLYADVTSRKRPMRREAREIVKRKLKAQGVKVSLLSAVTIAQLANAHLRRNAAELLAAAEASGAVQNLKVSHGRRNPRPPNVQRPPSLPRLVRLDARRDRRRRRWQSPVAGCARA